MSRLMNAADPQPLAGWVPQLADPSELFDALEKAFDYRGDVALTLADGRVVAGYLYDRRTGQGLEDSSVRLMPADGGENLTVVYADIRRLEFDKRDPAAGKSWENWLKRYAKAKLAGESADLQSDPLGD